MADTTATHAAVDFRTEPGRYKHWTLSVDGPVATLTMDVNEDGGLRPGYEAIRRGGPLILVDVYLIERMSVGFGVSMRTRFEPFAASSAKSVTCSPAGPG